MKSSIGNNQKTYNTNSNGNRLDPLIKVCYSNSRSLCNKLPKLLAIINSREYDILIFTETWLNPDITNGMISDNNFYTLFRLDRLTNTHGGSILIYIKHYYQAYALCHTISHNFELLNIVFFNYLFIVVYRPTSMSFNDTIKLCDIILSVSDSTKTSITYGDFNLPVGHVGPN